MFQQIIMIGDNWHWKFVNMLARFNSRCSRNMELNVHLKDIQCLCVEEGDSLFICIRTKKGLNQVYRRCLFCHIKYFTSNWKSGCKFF